MKTNHKNISGDKPTVHFCFLIVIGIVMSFSSCRKFLEIPPPSTEVVATSVFSDQFSATSAQLSIYAKMFQNQNSYKLALSMGMYADELKNYSTSRSQIALYTNSLLAANNTVWSDYLATSGGYYSYIYQANAVISGLQTSTGISTAVKQQLTGEAYFARAFWYFYLANIYGDVPLALTTDYTINVVLARTPRVQVLQQVVSDLQTAETMLNVNYVDATTDTAKTTERVRPNKAVAESLLARAELYLGDYSQKNTADYKAAETAATNVINNSNYSLSPLNGVFLKNSSEAIWQIQTLSGSAYDTPDGDYFILLGAPSTGNTNNVTISSQLMNSFEPNDQRKISWVGSYTPANTPSLTYYFPYKYKNYTYKGLEYDMVLRLGEQYLIRAEARAEQNNISGALQDLNVIRNRAGLPNYAGAQDQASVLAAILHERQVELFTEWGARWFDLERTGNAASVLGPPGNVCQAKGGTWNPNGYQLLFPVPQADILKDANLTQNPGY